MRKKFRIKNTIKANLSRVNPQITQQFTAFIRERAKNGIYRVKVKVGNKVIPIDVFPTVFPPQSAYSASSQSIFKSFGDLNGLDVADIGCGSGIESIMAVMSGAKHVDAVDINQRAVDCSRHNIKMNSLQDRINVFYSDLFKNFPKKKCNLIIANLPIVNFDAGQDIISVALYDSGFKLHKRLFVEAKNFLAEDGIIIFSHANLQSAQTANPDYDFQMLEKMIIKSGYEIFRKTEREDLDYTWINYKIKLKK